MSGAEPGDVLATAKNLAGRKDGHVVTNESAWLAISAWNSRHHNTHAAATWKPASGSSSAYRVSLHD